jgi:pyrimidine deaminase RibD-like protein
MFSAEERTRWGYLETRVDRSAEEEKELRELRQRFYEQVKGKSDADFDALQDANGSGSVTPMSERAKQQLKATAVPRDRDQFENYIKQSKREGYTVRRLHSGVNPVAPPPLLDSHRFRWEDLDNRLLSPKLQEISREMQKRSADGERKAEFDTRQSGNSAGYLPRLFDFQEQLTDEWAQRVFDAHCESWSQQNRTVTGEFIRAVRDRAIIQVIAARKSAVQSGVSLRGARTGKNPNSVALGDWNRRMDRLASRWNQRLESDAVAEDYRGSNPSNLNDDRYFALLAIEEARKSIAEDKRPHPKVGAVLVRDGKILAKAHRGENPKSHAEYVALEDKLPNETLAGATVYTTLEPCVKRKAPKIPCAGRLIERRVARVFIGMLDPNPDIRGLGDQLLSEAGIEVQLFPRDLRAQVEEMNREFIRDQKEKWNLRTSMSARKSADTVDDPAELSELKHTTLVSEIILEARYIKGEDDRRVFQCQSISEHATRYAEGAVPSRIERPLVVKGINVAEVDALTWEPTHVLYRDPSAQEEKEFAVYAGHRTVGSETLVFDINY